MFSLVCPQSSGVVAQINNEERLVNEKMRIAIDALGMQSRTEISWILKKLKDDVLCSYFKAKTPAQRQRYGDYLADIGAANQLKNLMEYLDNIGKYNMEWWDGMNIIRTILCNYANSSMKMAKEIGKSGLLEMLVREMQSLGPTALQDQVCQNTDDRSTQVSVLVVHFTYVLPPFFSSTRFFREVHSTGINYLFIYNIHVQHSIYFGGRKIREKNKLLWQGREQPIKQTQLTN